MPLESDGNVLAQEMKPDLTAMIEEKNEKRFA